jgi:hypothetical protein
VRQAASYDEYAEADEDPAERKVAPFPNEPDERDRNRKIGERNQEIRCGVEPDEAGIPEVAEAVWPEVTRAKKLP